MKHFKEYYKIEDYLKDVEKIETNKGFLISKALYSYLLENKVGKPFTNHETHVTNFGFLWENFLAKPTKNEELFNTLTFKSILSSIYDNKSVEERYENLTERLANGNIPYFHLCDAYDFESGVTFSIQFKNWEPSLLKFIPNPENWKLSKHVLAEPEPITKYVEKQVEFKTGNLLVADWFRIEKFNELVDNGNNSKFDVNSSKGRMNQALYYFDNFNFISNPSMANSTVYKSGSDYIFSYSRDNITMPASYQELASISKAYRALTIVEKEHLEELVGKNVVAQYLETGDAQIIKVAPGTYTFAISENPLEIVKNWKEKSITEINSEENKELNKLMNNKNFEPVLILRGVNMQLENTVTPKKNKL